MGKAVFSQPHVRFDSSSEGAVDSGLYSGVGYLFARAIESLRDGIAVTSQAEGKDSPFILYANAAFRSLSNVAADNVFGDSATSRQSCNVPLNDDPLWKCIEESHQCEGVYQTDLVLLGEEGRKLSLRFRSEQILDESGRVTHRIATVRDRTEQASLEESARRNERLACIGLLAAGIAHEINNPTGAALLAAETALAIKDLPGASEQLNDCLRNIVTSMDRCGRIVRTLLRYSRQETSEKQACNINDVVEQALDLARPYGESHGAELCMDLDAEVPLVPMNPLEIELVLVNLIRNAVEAGGGNVAISLVTRRTDNGVRVQVSDNGCGMNQEQLEHVFDPLYTTRRTTGGTGLGMSIVYGIIQGHEGSMDVKSQRFQGTTVTIELPIVAGSIGQESGKGNRNHGSNLDCRGRPAFCRRPGGHPGAGRI